MFKNFWGSQEQQTQPRPQEMTTDSWYPPSVGSSPSSSRPATPGANTPTGFGPSRPTDRPNTLSNVSPSEAAGIIAVLKDKSVDELRKLLSDKEAYQNLLLSVEPVKTQNRLNLEYRRESGKGTTHNGAEESGEFVDELRKLLSDKEAYQNLLLSVEPVKTQNRLNLEYRRESGKGTTHNGAEESELATAQENLHELERKKEETLKYYSPSSLLYRLQDAMNKTDEESETLHRQLLDGELDLSAFVQKYKKMRNTYHKRALTHIAAKTSATS
ncbi:vacuolar protein-sorting-associated protein 37 homolog 1 [Phtheirospermum japonicum]|uniref:Vacuolar protein-sorting-associated protein 37 homolog 1 n=1 Tax=Phtheirospermum japonicum TaxID=374723 RepID=A0A830BMR4_9LAMI|nr:vacuolar protein-sorting-associated protein 37 homolog 1 [Phtheirospermum japonicum]